MDSWLIRSLPACLSLQLLTAPLAAQERVLESYPVSSSGEMRYELVTGEPCDEEMCKARVVLMNGEQKLGSAELEWGFITGKDPVKEKGCWYTRIDGAQLATCPSPVQLGSDFNGILVSQTAGWDHVLKDQKLYVAISDTLAKVWAQGSGWGPEWKSAWVTDVDGDGIDEVVTLYRAYSPWPDELHDTWELRTLEWDNNREDLTEVVEHGRMQAAYAAIVGSYESLPEARRQREQLGRMENPIPMIKTSCLTAFGIYRSDDFRKLKPGWFIVASLSIERPKAAAELGEAEACSSAIDGYIKRAQ